MSHKKPDISRSAQKELDDAEKQFQAFDQQVKNLTLDSLNSAPQEEVEQQTKLSQKQISNSKEIYLKPKRTIGSKEKFNEAFRSDYEFAKELVYFTAENNELIGCMIESLWTKPFPGLPAEEWDIPVNKPVWGPRYLAERLKNCTYHRLSMDESQSQSSDGMGIYTGKMIAKSTVNRLNAFPASQTKSVFMGKGGF